MVLRIHIVQECYAFHESHRILHDYDVMPIVSDRVFTLLSRGFLPFMAVSLERKWLFAMTGQLGLQEREH